MAMFRPVDTTGNALQNIIPLLVQKKRDQEELAYKDKVLQIKRDELKAEAEERAQKLKDEATKTRVRYLTDMYKAGVEKGDPKLAEGFGSQLLAEGLPVAAEVQPSNELDMTGRPNLKWLVAQPQLTGEAKNLETILGRTPKLEDLKALKQKEGLTGTAKNLEILLNRKPTIEELKEHEQKDATPSSLKKLTEERDALPPGDPKRKLYDQAIEKEVHPSTRDAIYTKTIDLGDKVRAYKKDGTFDDLPKSVSPTTILTTDRRRATDEMAIRKEFTALPEVKNHVIIDSQYQRLGKAMEEAKGGGSKIAVDQALITILNKMLDPASVVRESEYARTPQDMAFLSRIKGKYEKLKEGGAGLTLEEREAVFRMAENFYGVSKSMYDQQVSYYTDLANRYGYAPENIVRLGGAKGSYKEIGRAHV